MFNDEIVEYNAQEMEKLSLDEQNKRLYDALQSVCEEIDKKLRKDGFITKIEVAYMFEKALGFDFCLSDANMQTLAEYCCTGYTVNPLYNHRIEEV